MNIQNSNIEYAIGIDLGHGETSVAICPIQRGVDKSQMDPVKDMDMGSNRKVIPSAITIMQNGDAFIGDSAFTTEHLDHAAESYLCFKKMPEDINGKAEQVMIRFMKEIYKLIREKNQALLTDNNHIIAIATPSGWPKQAMNLYKEMAIQAGMPIEFVTLESRAAFIKAQNDVTSGLSRNITKGAIVFDMGSSTLDFTFMCTDKQSTYIDHGYNCGASEVEKIMYKKLQEENPIIKDFLLKYPKLDATFLYKVREVKEKNYFEPETKVKSIINFEELVEDDDDFEDERVRIKYAPGELNQQLVDYGYIQKIKDAMMDFKCNHINNAEIYGVLLTGGASRMDFIKDLVKECWDVDDTQIYRDQDPSLTISEGVAEVARIDMLTNGSDEGLVEQIESLINNNSIYETFIDIYTTYLANASNQCIATNVTNFKDSSDDFSIKFLCEAISDDIDEFFKADGSSNVKAGVEEALNNNTEEIRTRIDSIVSYYRAQGSDITIPEINIPALKISPISLYSEFRSLSNQLAEEASNWGGVLGYAAAGAAIGSFIPGVGTLLGGIAGGAYAAFKNSNKTESEKIKEVMEKDLDQEQRIKVYQYMENNWEPVTTKIQESIEKSLRNDADLREAINEITKKYLVEYRDCLKKSRVLID